MVFGPDDPRRRPDSRLHWEPSIPVPGHMRCEFPLLHARARAASPNRRQPTDTRGIPPSLPDGSRAARRFRRLARIYIVGGGISGVLKALRRSDDVKRSRVRVICRDIGPETRKGLTEGLITAALCHPLDKISEELIATMVTALENRGDTILQRVVPFEIITPESV